MKILICHNHYKENGGEDSVLESETEMLKAQGHEVTLFTKDNKTISNISEKIDAFFQSKYSTVSRQELRLLIKERQPDIIHVHNFFPQMSPSIYDAAYAENIPVIQTLHNYRIICASALLLRNNQVCELCLNKSSFHAVKHKCYQNSVIGSYAVSRMINHHKKNDTWNKRVDKFIALTNFAKSKFISYGIDSNKIIVKPNFLPDSMLTSSQHTNADVENSFVLFVGRLSKEKGVELLLSAWSNNANLPKLKIVGNGPLLNEVKQASSINTNIEYLGQRKRENILELMGKAICLVFPSLWYEGFPMVIVEAFSCGLPVVSTNLGSMKEIVLDDLNGFTFDPKMPNMLCNQILRINTDRDLRDKLGSSARKTFIAKYCQEKNYENLISIYSNAIESHNNIK